MAMAIHSLGSKAISLTGAQIGIRTDSTHTKARIRSISTDRMRQLLDEGNIVIAAGFQGIDEHFNITTLGRGGSDTTAVALAAVLGADSCEIYTDVDGVYTTDPRMLPEARRISQVSYDEMLELASLGAGVMHSRSIEFAKKFSVPIHVRSSFTDIQGSLIVAEPESPDQAVGGAAMTKDEARMTIYGVPDRPGSSEAIFSRIAARAVTVDMIVQNVGEEGRADISFTVLRDELRATRHALTEAVQEIGATGFTCDEGVSKISVVGLGMARQTGVADRMFQALADAGVNIQMISTSEIKITVLVARESALDALRAVHREFHLETPPALPPAPAALAAAAKGPSDAVDVIRRLAGMEDLAIEDVTLDETQARITISQVPDQKGVAATIFRQIAQAEVFVDMIVQGFSSSGQASLSFTVPHQQLSRALMDSAKLATSLGCGAVTSSAHVAKLSVSGIGLRSHTGVAIRMFRSLSEAGINVEMINTSEVRVNVVVDGRHGQQALKCLEAAFADVLQ
ncbi:MAG: aspartate kinase, partial [Planctomycetia bacterium]|nr:aspartate kinase [Planctomycetia bacterium]